ncbi:MAG: hypothetical protein ACRBN8_37550 [Nannocystales bacterium]
MAHLPVEELRTQMRPAGALQRIEPSAGNAPVRTQGTGDLRSWVEKSPLPPGGLLLGGVGLAMVGLGLGLALPLTLGTATLFGGMVTFGGGVAFLGALKRKSQLEAAQTQALPPAPTVSPTVLAERGRRVQGWLQERRQATFEELAQALRWTESALVETLLHMKQAGVVEEDLDLDTGQWVYRMQTATETGTAASLMLSERDARNG